MASLSLHSRAAVDDSRQASVYGFAIAFMIAITFVILLRMYVRVFMTKAVGAEDILMVIGAMFTVGLSVASMIAAYYGVGKHLDDLDPQYAIPMMRAIYSTRLLYVLAMWFVKMSLLVFYLRLDTRRSMRWTVYGLIFVVTGFSIASFIILAVSCFPPALFWDQTVEGDCMTPAAQQAFYDANGVINIITDVAIYLTPMPILRKIGIPRRQRAALMAIFGLGFLSVAAGCVRFGYVRMLADEPDMFFYLADSLNWCGAEIYLAIICGSASAFKMILRSWFPRIFGSSAYGYRYKRSHENTNSYALTSKGVRSNHRASCPSRAVGPSDVTEVAPDDQEELIIQTNRPWKREEAETEASRV